MIHDKHPHPAALFVAATLFSLLLLPSALAQSRSTNIPGTGNTLQTTASNSAIVTGQNNTMAGINSAIIGAANSRVAAGALMAFIGGGNVGSVLGGANNAVVAGFSNTVAANATRSVVAGGTSNTLAAVNGAVVGGEGNVVTNGASRGFIGGGQFNEVQAPGGAVVGGFANEAAGANSFAAGSQAVASNTGTFVWADMSSPTDFVSTGVNQFLIRANGGVGINTNNPGGNALLVNGDVRVTGRLISGIGNAASGSFAVVGGGSNNSASGNFSFVGGGLNNTSSVNTATIAGGSGNTASSGVATVGGGIRNTASGNGATVAGGRFNTNVSERGFIGGGDNNIIAATATNAVISGGISNSVSALHAVIGGGDRNRITNPVAEFGTVAGGRRNDVNGIGGTIGGGGFNVARGVFSTVPGGTLGRATHDGSFVWNGDPNNFTDSFRTNSFTVRCLGGARFYTAAGTTTGVSLAPGSGGWTSLSDRHAKENFEEVNASDVLAKVAAMPVRTWNYKTQKDDIRHIGPTAQDFKAAFGVGESETGITTVDADGVALAAIKGLVEELKERDKAIEELKAWSKEQGARSQAEVDEMKAKLQAFEQRLNSLPPKP